jgi:hypothetical protein
MSTVLLVVLVAVVQAGLLRLVWVAAHKRGYRTGFNRAYALRDAAELATSEQEAVA